LPGEVAAIVLEAGEAEPLDRACRALIRVCAAWRATIVPWRDNMLKRCPPVTTAETLAGEHLRSAWQAGYELKQAALPIAAMLDGLFHHEAEVRRLSFVEL
jgi:hypothetical protein